MTVQATEQQREVIAAVASGEGADMLVRARAGTGKTWTLLQAIAARPRGKSAILCAFNLDIAKELRRKAPPNVIARTLHGLGREAINGRFRGVTIDRHRERRQAGEVCGPDEPGLVLDAVSDLACAAKEQAPSEATNHDIMRKVGMRLGILPSGEELADTGWSQAGVIRAAALVVERATDLKADPCISFPDMLYLPLVMRLPTLRADIVVVDELQDLGLAQIQLSTRLRAHGARFMGLGDDRQSIYSWRGAFPDALDRIRNGLKAREYKLTVTHRCARLIVEQAQSIVPDIEAAAGAPDGIVRSCAWKDLATSAQPGDFVIGRTNAILVLACLRMLRAGTRARVVGSDLAPTMSALVRRLARGTGGDMVRMAEKIAAWIDREVRTARARQNDQAEALAKDKGAVLDAILDDCDTIDEMIQRIRDLFDDDGTTGHVVCSTVHKAKGLEADRVWMLTTSFTPPRADDSPTEVIEAANLRYVTMTRARHELIYVQD